MISVPDKDVYETPGRIKAFAYLTAEKAQLYRAIMCVFMQSKERFVFHLRQQDVFNAVRLSGLREVPEQTEIEHALAQLCEWGNLQAHPDTTDVGAVEDFYKHRHAFQITSQGEGVERAVALFAATSKSDGELTCAGLADIRSALEDLQQLSREPEPDGGKIQRNWLVLRSRFEDVTATAQTLIGRLECRSDIEVPAARRLIDYAERFVGELVLATDSIGETVRDVEAVGLERLLHAAAERGVRDGVDRTPESVACVGAEWRSHWDRLRNWFISSPDRRSNAELLRERARTSIAGLLSVITRINEGRIQRIDRSNDFRVLARWFANAGSDAEAHRLWRTVFGLSPARHLITNDATLDDHEAEHVPASTSWLDAPPLRISTRLRDFGSNSRTGRLSRIIDRTAEKEKLAAAAHEEALRILSAQARFGTGGRMRLSELDRLDTGEFDLFLDLLGEAVSARVLSSEAVEILSGDGCLKIKLEPTSDGREASILTMEGVFSGPDHWISIAQISSEEVLM